MRRPAPVGMTDVAGGGKTAKVVPISKKKAKKVSGASNKRKRG
jgi:hypothetical protein